MPTILKIGLFALLCVFTAAIILTTAGNMKTVKDLAWGSMENSCLAISTAAQNALNMKGMVPGEEFMGILSDRVVAYAYIADVSGRILFHTNSGLKGYMMKGFSPPPSSVPFGERITLGTGVSAYRYIFPLRTLPDAGQYLVLVMNTAETEAMISKAGRIWWTAGTVIIMLWGLGVVFERLFARTIRYEAEMQRQRELGMIGQMTSVLAHEVRNALGGLKGYAQWVDEKTEEGDGRKQALGFIIEGSDRIGSLVNEMLLFSREETYARNRVNVRSLIDQCMNETMSSHEGGKKLSVEDDIYVTADGEKLKRVLVNGLINALDASPADGEISVAAGLSRGIVEIRIEDSGMGLGEEEMKKAFTPFFTTKTNGTGLGLAYARKVVSGMGGDIELMNRAGAKGAVLAIRMPGGKEG